MIHHTTIDLAQFKWYVRQLIRVMLVLCSLAPWAVVAQDNPFSGQLLNQKLDSLTGAAKVDYINDNFYKIYSADFETGRAKAKEALELSQRLGYKLGEANSALSLGVIVYLSGDYENTLPNYILSESIFDSLKDERGLIRIRNEMAVFYRKQGNDAKSLELLKYTERKARERGEIDLLGTSLGMQATHYTKFGEHGKAEELYTEVYKIRAQRNDSIGMGYVLLDMAEININQKEYEKALNYIDQSREIRELIGDNQGVAICLITKGEAYLAMGSYLKAQEYMEQSLAMSEAIGFTDLSKYIYDQLINVNVAQANYQAAYVYKTRSSALKDSLFNINRSRLIEELNTKYETAQKEQKIAIQEAELKEKQAFIQRNVILTAALAIFLVLAIAIIFLIENRNKKQRVILIKEREVIFKEAQISAALESQESERKRFAQDLHDGFGQLISSLKIFISQIQKSNDLETKTYAFEKSEKVLEEMHREIRNIAFNLMPTTLIQFGLPAAIREFAQRLNQTGKIKATVDTFEMDDRLTELQEISLYRVVQESVNNILKYANADRIDLQLIRHEEEILLMIEDNGDGYDTAVLEQNKGNGWRNIQSRLNRIGASINIDSKQGTKGTTIEITIPYIKMISSPIAIREETPI